METSALKDEARSRARRRRILWLTAAALLSRVLLIVIFHTYRSIDTPNHHGFAFETGSIAGSLASGQGFSSPFGEASGPTAWIAPVYPALLAAAFKIFGLYTEAAAATMLIFNSICAALTVPVIDAIGRKVFDEETGETAAWIWALVPFFARWPVTWVWETSLTALLGALVFLLSLELVSDEWQRWAGLGAFWGAIALASPSILGFLPASFLYPAARMSRGWRVAISRLAVGGLFFVLAISPWLARNEAVFHRPIFLRSNFWFEANLSNFVNSTGEAWGGRHPARNEAVLQRYIRLGEPQFVAEAKKQVFGFIKANPGEFAELTAIRILHFWDGGELMYESPNDPFRPWMVTVTSLLAFAGLWMAARSGRAWQLFGWLMLLYPIPYYITYTNPRYRHPIEPMMVVLTGFLCVELVRRRRAMRRS